MTTAPSVFRVPTLGIIKALTTTIKRLRPRPLTIAGFASIDIAAFTGNTIAGWAVTGVSLLLLDWTLDSEDPHL